MRDNKSKKLVGFLAIAALIGGGQTLDQIQLGFQMDTPSSDALVAQKSHSHQKDVSENQKKLFAAMQKKSGSEIQIYDMSQQDPEAWREDLPDLRLAIQK